MDSRQPGLGSESVSIPVPWESGRWASDTRPKRTGFWLGSLGYTPSVPVLAHRLGQSEQSYLEKWPFGGQIWFEPAAAQIHVNQHLGAKF